MFQQNGYEEFKESSKRRGVGIRPRGCRLQVANKGCSQDGKVREILRKEEKEIENGQEEIVVGGDAPQAVNIPLEVQVGSVASLPESPSPSSPSPPPGVPFPPQGSPLGDLPSIMGFYTMDDISELEQWSVDARAVRGDPSQREEKPENLGNFKLFLRLFWGAQWQLKLLRCSGEVIFCQLKAYLAGYNSLTSFNRRLWLRLFPAWMVGERQEHLESWSHLQQRAGF